MRPTPSATEAQLAVNSRDTETAVSAFMSDRLRVTVQVQWAFNRLGSCNVNRKTLVILQFQVFVQVNLYEPPYQIRVYL